jgi:uncharacterized protein YycO
MFGINGLKIIKAITILIVAPIIVAIISTMFDVFYKTNQQTVVENRIILDGKNIIQQIQTEKQSIKMPREKTENINEISPFDTRIKCSGSLDDSIDCPL